LFLSSIFYLLFLLLSLLRHGFRYKFGYGVSPFKKKPSNRGQRASRAAAIKPDARGVKQLDHSIDGFFVAGVPEEYPVASLNVPGKIHTGERSLRDPIAPLESKLYV
jgi:hypothetical protein